MKKIMILTAAICSFMVVFTGCEKEDIRDQYVGSYNETAVGTVSVVVNGETGTVPIDFSGTYQISKGSAETSLIKLEGSQSLNGVFTNPSVTFEPETETVALTNGGSMQLTISMTGTFSTNIFITTRKITGTFFYQGASYPVSGTITGNATKL